MEVETVSRRTERPVALDAGTACAAFQATAAAHPNRVAIRTRRDEFSCTWREYAVNAWPTLAVISPEGYVLGMQAGEVTAEELTPVIRQFVDALKASRKMPGGPPVPYQPQTQPPEPGTAPPLEDTSRAAARVRELFGLAST